VSYLSNEFFPTIEHLGRYYDYSPKRVANLERAQQTLYNKTIKLVQSAFTRWLSHDNVTRVLLASIVAVLVELQASR
jgi:hypothetical protein